MGVIYQMTPHPPQNLSGFDFRSTTGADNLGKAGMPYARTVPVVKQDKKPPSAEDVFDRLLKRDTKDGEETVRSANFRPTDCLALTILD